MMNNFNFVASVYDLLVRLVFGHEILRATVSNFEILGSGKWLVLGGGTGKFLPFVPTGTKLTFLEKSSRMLALTKKRKHRIEVDYIEEDFFLWDVEDKFDVIICPFFLDCFEQENLDVALRKIRQLLSEEGKLLVADFSQERSNKILIKAMHLFFKLFASLESNSLKDIRSATISKGFEELEVRYFKFGIFSGIYKKGV